MPEQIDADRNTEIEQGLRSIVVDAVTVFEAIDEHLGYARPGTLGGARKSLDRARSLLTALRSNLIPLLRAAAGMKDDEVL